MQLEVVKYFSSKKGAQLMNWKDNRGVHPIHLAAATRNPEVLALLIEKVNAIKVLTTKQHLR